MSNEFVMVPREPTAEMLAAAKKSGVIDPRVSGYCYALMVTAAPTHQSDAIGTLVRDYNERIVFTPIGDPHIIDDMKVYAHADPGEVERLRKENADLCESLKELNGIERKRDAALAQLEAEKKQHAQVLELATRRWGVIAKQDAKLAERDALLREAHEELVCRDSPVAQRITAALSYSAE